MGELPSRMRSLMGPWAELDDAGAATVDLLMDPLPIPDGDAVAAIAAEVPGVLVLAASAGEPPLPPPAMAPEPPPVITVRLPNGRISFYAKKNSFEAVCSNRKHGKCVMTRTAVGSAASSTSPLSGGRPVGFLAAWLAHAEHTDDKETHWNIDCQLNSVAVRSRARVLVQGSPDGDHLLAQERQVAAGGLEEAADDFLYVKLQQLLLA